MIKERRLKEVASYPYASQKHLSRVLQRKSTNLNPTEAHVLANFPEEGIDLGFTSNALIFAPALCRMAKKEHVAIISLLRMGYLDIGELVDFKAHTRSEIILKS